MMRRATIDPINHHADRRRGQATDIGGRIRGDGFPIVLVLVLVAVLERDRMHNLSLDAPVSFENDDEDEDEHDGKLDPRVAEAAMRAFWIGCVTVAIGGSVIGAAAGAQAPSW